MGRPRADRWMVSYADLLTLLLALFVVLFVAHENRGGVEAPDVEASGSEPTPRRVDGIVPEEPGAEMAALGVEIAAFASRMGLDRKIRTRLEPRGLVVSLVEAGFFDPGRAEPKEEALPVIDALGRRLASSRYHLRIEGHTDDTPIRTTRFPSNWELSTSRATWLVAYFTARFGLAPERISAAGYAEFRPVASNTTPEGRARNRRVDIVLLSPNVVHAEEPGRTEDGGL